MTPTSRLEVFLAMIAGEPGITPIMPKTETEYWLNEIAVSMGGSPWREESGGGDTPSEKTMVEDDSK